MFVAAVDITCTVAAIKRRSCCGQSCHQRYGTCTRTSIAFVTFPGVFRDLFYETQHWGEEKGKVANIKLNVFASYPLSDVLYATALI